MRGHLTIRVGVVIHCEDLRRLKRLLCSVLSIVVLVHLRLLHASEAATADGTDIRDAHRCLFLRGQNCTVLQSCSCERSALVVLRLQRTDVQCKCERLHSSSHRCTALTVGGGSRRSHRLADADSAVHRRDELEVLSGSKLLEGGWRRCSDGNRGWRFCRWTHPRTRADHEFPKDFGSRLLPGYRPPVRAAVEGFHHSPLPF